MPEEIVEQEDVKITETPVEGEESTQEKPAEEKTSVRKEQKTVPLAALHEERERRKKADAKADAVAKDFMAKQEKINKRLAEIFTGEEGGTSQEVRFEDKPVEFLRKQIDDQKGKTEKIEGFFQQQQAMQELQSYAASNVAVFKKEAPDYDEAYDFIRAERIGEIMDIYECDEAAAAQRVNEEELGFTLQCAREGRNPAKSLYAFAKRRGYKPSEGDGEKKLDNLQKGMNGSKSLSSAAGKSPTGLTAEALLAMDDQEYSEFKKKHPEKFRQLMGATS